MAGWAAVAGSSKGRVSAARSRAEVAAQRRAERWLTRRQQQRRAEAAAITARLARERLEGRA